VIVLEKREKKRKFKEKETREKSNDKTSQEE
jgi:hypothetical protein